MNERDIFHSPGEQRRCNYSVGQTMPLSLPEINSVIRRVVANWTRDNVFRRRLAPLAGCRLGKKERPCTQQCVRCGP